MGKWFSQRKDQEIRPKMKWLTAITGYILVNVLILASFYILYVLGFVKETNFFYIAMVPQLIAFFVVGLLLGYWMGYFSKSEILFVLAAGFSSNLIALVKGKYDFSGWIFFIVAMAIYIGVIFEGAFLGVKLKKKMTKIVFAAVLVGCLSLSILMPVCFYQCVIPCFNNYIIPWYISYHFEGGTYIILEVEKERKDFLDESEMLQIAEITKIRLQSRGIKRWNIISRPEGGGKIGVLLPYKNDSEYTQKVINMFKQSELEIKLVDDFSPIGKEISEMTIAPGEENVFLEKFNAKVSADTEILFEDIVNAEGKVTKKPYLLEKDVLMNGASVEDARVKFREYGHYIAVSFTKADAKQLENITRSNIGRMLAIILNGKVYSAPVIREPVTGGRIMISGRFSEEEANDFAIVMRAGSLGPALNVVAVRELTKEMLRQVSHQK